MSSRQEEKERRRREREEAEQASRRAESRRKRVGVVVGGVLVAALIAVGILAFASGSDSGSGPDSSSATKAPNLGITDLTEAAEKAGCKINNPKHEGNGHTEADVKYAANPPTSGAHHPVPAEEGVYPEPPDLEQSVHSLEHGRINFQYQPGSPAERVSQLEGLFNEEARGSSGYHSLLFENQTEMDAAVAATAWDHSITCAEWNDQVFDALRAFRIEYLDKGPEIVP
jgi:hypothetical protein